MIQEGVIKQVAKEYNTLNYLSELSVLLEKMYPAETFVGAQKQELHLKLNQILIKEYNGEQIIKYRLYDEYCDKNVVAAFEVRVNNSRADFLAVNGVSRSFEIKSDLDTLTKLKKQATDYEMVFDYNYIVIDRKHLVSVERIVPPNFGIWSYHGGKKTVHRKAVRNIAIQPEMQLRLLSKRELQRNFKNEGGQVKKILKNYSESEINKSFKVILKDRYRSRWSFIVNFRKEIMPLDLQFFFNTNIQPKYIYQY